MLQNTHIHPKTDLVRHNHLVPHNHTIRNITNTTTNWSWNPSAMWTRNNIVHDSVSVSWTTNVSTTAAKTTSLKVGVTDSVITTKLGSSYTSSHTISTSYTRIFDVPYKYDGRILVTFDRNKAHFTCVTTFTPVLAPSWEETGTCSALGSPKNMVVQLEMARY